MTFLAGIHFTVEGRIEFDGWLLWKLVVICWDLSGTPLSNFLCCLNFYDLFFLEVHGTLLIAGLAVLPAVVHATSRGECAVVGAVKHGSTWQGDHIGDICCTWGFVRYFVNHSVFTFSRKVKTLGKKFFEPWTWWMKLLWFLPEFRILCACSLKILQGNRFWRPERLNIGW